MRFVAGLLFLLILGPLPKAYCQEHAYKSEDTVARMTPDERVEEYCREHGWLDDWHRKYYGMLFNYIKADGLKALPAMIEFVDGFDPTTEGKKNAERDANSQRAELLLSRLDEKAFRLRASAEGRAAIEAIRREVDRMRRAHFATANDQGEHSPQARYRLSVTVLEQIEGLSLLDESVRNTFELKYKIRLDDKELLDFSNYLTTQDPYYPSWTETEWFVDKHKLNEAGNPLQYAIVKIVEPFYRAYLTFRSKHQ